MQQLVRQLRKSAFVRYNAIFFVGSMAVGFLNYLFYPVLGRLLHPGSFGEVQALASLFAQIAIFLNVLGLITVNIVANYENAAVRNRVILELERLAVLIGLALLIIAVGAGGMLKHFFHFSSMWPFSALALAILVSVPLTFRSAYLRGLNYFGPVSVIGIVGSAADLLLAAIFVLAGLGTTGAILGLVVGQLAALSLAALQSQRHGFSESWRASLFRLPDVRLIRPELKYALLVLVGSLGITGLYSTDIIVVKHYFDANTAGLYAGVSTVARILYFMTASIAQVLLPSIKLSHTPRENRLVLLKSFVLLAGVGGAALLAFTLLPRPIIRILMGSKYLPLAYLLPRLSLMLFIISLLNLFVLYFMALRRYAIALIVMINITVTYGFLRFNHQNSQAVVDSLLYGSLSMMLSIGVWLGGTKLKERKLRGV